MAKKKFNVKKKVSVSKTPSKVVSKPVKKKVSYSWIWYALGVLVLLGALYLIFSGMTGNAITITGNAVDTKNAFNPMVVMVSGVITNVYEVSKPVLEKIVGDTTAGQGVLASSSDIFFAKVLLLILILAIVSSVLLTSGVAILQEGWTHWVVSGVVAILSVRFLSADLINTMLIPYSTFGVVISSVIPLILYFFFVEKSLGTPKPAIVRRIAWVFFAVVFLSIWIMRQDDFSDNAGLISIIYPVTALLAIALAVLDGTIQKFFNSAKVGRLKASANARVLKTYLDQINKCNDDWKAAAARGHPDSYNANIKNVGAATGQKAYQDDLKELRTRINKNKN